MAIQQKSAGYITVILMELVSIQVSDVETKLLGIRTMLLSQIGWEIVSTMFVEYSNQHQIKQQPDDVGQALN